MSLSDFEVIKVLGKGAFGSVSLVLRILDNNKYAMKTVKLIGLTKKEIENALNEVRILASITHPNIIGYKEAFYDSKSETLNIVMEFADDGDLDSKIKKHKQNGTRFAENDIWSYLIQITQGLMSLHNNKIMHRDLKSANIFLTKKGVVKLGDLNVSKVVKRDLVYTQTGTPYYASPEVWADRPYSYKSDLWSLGCIMYELCGLRPPFVGKSLEELYQAVTQGIYDPIPSIYSKDLSKIISLLLEVDPNRRLSCAQILNHPLVIKRMDFNDEMTTGNAMLINTIKLPKNLDEINSQLPRRKKYQEYIYYIMFKELRFDYEKYSISE